METKTTMRYINRKGNGYTETVDECDSKKEALYLIHEYRLSDPGAQYWISSRACKDWN